MLIAGTQSLTLNLAANGCMDAQQRIRLEDGVSKIADEVNLQTFHVPEGVTFALTDQSLTSSRAE